jgi:cell wall-associated NlpC family hydrolase
MTVAVPRRYRLLIAALALVVIALAYVETLGRGALRALRSAAACVLGATVIGSVYAQTVARTTQRRPGGAASVLALVLAFGFPPASPAPVGAAYDPVDAVVRAGKNYVGSGYRLGGVGPRYFDCSGFIYRALADAGELPRIGGMRRRAAGYTSWFVARGRFARNHSVAERGDLVAYTNGRRITHIGLYLGDGKVLSALVTGVTVHRLHSLNYEAAYYLRVNWSGGDAGSGNSGRDTAAGGRDRRPAPGKPAGNDAGDPRANSGHGPGHADGFDGQAIGTMNLRRAADPDARIIGWIGRGRHFRILSEGTSPAGYLWFQVETKSGKTGWVYSRWVRKLDRS